MLYRRLLAFVIDLCVLFLGLLLLQVLLLPLSAVWSTQIHDTWAPYLWLVLTVSVPSWVYFILLDLWPPHATIGNALMGLQVESTSDRPIVTTRALRRTAIKMLPWEIFLASIMLPQPLWIATDLVQPRTSFYVAAVLAIIYIVIFFLSGGTRGLHDLLSKTRVADMPKKHDKQS